jgi:hypothetical protein
VPTNLYHSEILVRNSGLYTVYYLKVGSAFEVTLQHDDDSLTSCGEWPDFDAAAGAVREVLERADEEKAAKKAMLRKMITVALSGLQEKGNSLSSYTAVDYVYENRSSKDVRAFEGRITYRDVLGNEVADTDMKVLTPIKNGQKSNTTDMLPLTTHRGLRGARLEDVEIEWNPTKILFVDGTSETSSFPNAADLVRIAATVHKG